MCGIVPFACFLVCKGNPPHFPMQYLKYKCLYADNQMFAFVHD